MEEKGYTEKDWRLFSSKIADWQENYMEKLNSDYVALLTGEGLASEKFWQLEKRIKEDKKIRVLLWICVVLCFYLISLVS